MEPTAKSVPPLIKRRAKAGSVSSAVHAWRWTSKKERGLVTEAKKHNFFSPGVETLKDEKKAAGYGTGAAIVVAVITAGVDKMTPNKSIKSDAANGAA
jgi:hypothetical protein